MLSETAHEELAELNKWCDANHIGAELNISQAARYLGCCRQTASKNYRFNSKKKITRRLFAKQIAETYEWRIVEDY